MTKTEAEIHSEKIDDIRLIADLIRLSQPSAAKKLDEAAVYFRKEHIDKLKNMAPPRKD